MICLTACRIPGPPPPVFRPRLIIGTLMVNARSRVVKVTRFLPFSRMHNKTSQLKETGQGGQGGQGDFSPITRACAYFLLLFLKSSFLKKNIDHLDQTNTEAGFHPDHPPGPPLTTLTRTKKEEKTMGTAFDLLKNKYGVVESQTKPQEDTEAQGLTEWKDSAPVVMLSAFLKEYNDQGFALEVTREGQPTLSFDPGLTTKDHDPDRWDLALHARYLFAQARADLQDLILHGLINLKQHFLI